MQDYRYCEDCGIVIGRLWLHPAIHKCEICDGQIEAYFKSLFAKDCTVCAMEGLETIINWLFYRRIYAW